MGVDFSQPGSSPGTDTEIDKTHWLFRPPEQYPGLMAPKRRLLMQVSRNLANQHMRASRRMFKAAIVTAFTIVTISVSPAYTQNQTTTYILGKIEISRDISPVENDAFNPSLA